MTKIYRVSGGAPLTVHVRAQQGSLLYADLWYDEDDAHWWNLEQDAFDDQSSEWKVGPLASIWTHKARTFQQRDLHRPFETVQFDPGLNNEFTFDLDARVGSLSGGSQLSVVEVTVTQNGNVVRSEDGNPHVVVGSGTTSNKWEKLVFRT